MDNRFIVIDTNIVDNAFLKENCSGELMRTCMLVLFAFIRNEQLFIVWDDDPENGNRSGFIETEYWNKLRHCRDFELFYSKLFEHDKIRKVKPLYSEDIQQKLSETGFHEKQDHVFVFTALAADKIIVTEDSDYGLHNEPDKKEAYEYLTGELGLRLFDAQGFTKEI